MSPDNCTDIKMLTDERVIDSDFTFTISDFQKYSKLTERTSKEVEEPSDSDLNKAQLDRSYYSSRTCDAIENAPFLCITVVQQPRGKLNLWPLGQGIYCLILGGRLPEAQSDPAASVSEEQRHDRAETTNAQEIAQADMAEEVENLFRTAQEEDFEDGLDNELTERLLKIVKDYGRPVICEIHHLLINEKVSPESAKEVLRWLGSMDDEDTYGYRSWLLKQALVKSKSPTVRDGANIGLGFMDDPDAIPDLKQAIQKETCVILCEFMKQTLAQLENTQKCLSF